MKMELINRYIQNHDWKSGVEYYSSLSKKEQLSKNIVILSLLSTIGETEEKAGVKGVFWRKEVTDAESLILLYYKVKYILRRIEYDVGKNNEIELLNMNLSAQMIVMMVSLFSIDKQKVARSLCRETYKTKNVQLSQILEKYYKLK